MILKLNFLFIFFTLSAHSGELIINGKNTTLANHPWQVSIQKDGEHSCGGAIISKRFIITASHCETNKDSVIKAGGDGHLNNLKKVGVIKQVFDAPHTDISLIEMTEDMVFNQTTAPIELPNKKDRKNLYSKEVTFSLSGWGKDEYDLPSVQLKETNYLTLLPTYSHLDFWAIHKTKFFSKSMFKEYGKSWGTAYLAFDANDNGLCKGDSGGAVVMKRNGRNTIVGVASFFGGSAYCSGASVFASISVIQKWIMGILNR